MVEPLSCARVVLSSPFRNDGKAGRRREILRNLTMRSLLLASRQSALLASRLVQSYDHLNSTRPLFVKGLTSGALLGAGDVLCQKLQRTSTSLDGERAARMLGWGALFNGPAGHVWYRMLDIAVRSTAARGVALKILLDQLLFTPPLTLGYFVWQHSLSNRTGPASAWESACQQLWPTLRVNWMYWSLVHVATFTLIPLNYRVAFVATKNFFWGGYLSWAAAAAET